MTQAIRKSTTTPEMYFQLREPHTSRTGRRYRAATAFARLDNWCWHTSLVRCSEEDNFNRAAGRSIAKRRFQRGAIDLITNEAPTYEQVVAIYKEV